MLGQFNTNKTDVVYLFLELKLLKSWFIQHVHVWIKNSPLFSFIKWYSSVSPCPFNILLLGFFFKTFSLFPWKIPNIISFSESPAPIANYLQHIYLKLEVKYSKHVLSILYVPWIVLNTFHVSLVQGFQWQHEVTGINCIFHMNN